MLRANRLKIGSAIASIAEHSSGMASGGAPAITALIATFSTVARPLRGGRSHRCSSGNRPDAATWARTRSSVGGMSGRPSPHPASVASFVNAAGSSSTSRRSLASQSIVQPSGPQSTRDAIGCRSPCQPGDLGHEAPSVSSSAGQCSTGDGPHVGLGARLERDTGAHGRAGPPGRRWRPWCARGIRTLRLRRRPPSCPRGRPRRCRERSTRCRSLSCRARRSRRRHRSANSSSSAKVRSPSSPMRLPAFQTRTVGAGRRRADASTRRAPIPRTATSRRCGGRPRRPARRPGVGSGFGGDLGGVAVGIEDRDAGHRTSLLRGWARSDRTDRGPAGSTRGPARHDGPGCGQT